MLRAAVIQVVRHLVLRTVPASQRVPLFDQATGLLDEAGWGLDELVTAAEPGPGQDALLQALGLWIPSKGADSAVSLGRAPGDGMTTTTLPPHPETSRPVAGRAAHDLSVPLPLPA